MATITPTVSKLGGDETVVKVLWEGLTYIDATPGPETFDDGAPAEWPHHADRSVQVLGTFAGSTLVIEGSNDGTNYYTLNDVAGSPLSFTTAGVKQVQELTQYIRPRVSVGNESMDLDVALVMRRPAEMRT